MRKRSKYLAKRALTVILSVSMALSPAAGAQAAGIVLADEIDKTNDSVKEDAMQRDYSVENEKTDEEKKGGEKKEAYDQLTNNEDNATTGETTDEKEETEAKEENRENEETEAKERNQEKEETEAKEGREEKEESKVEEGNQEEETKVEEESGEKESKEKESAESDETIKETTEKEIKPTAKAPEMAAALDEMDGEEYDKEKTSSYDWEEDWEQYVSEGDIVTWLNFSKSDDPAEIMLDGFKKGDSKNNIEGPEGSNCAEEGAKNWKDNGNLKVVDLAGSSSTGEAEDSYDGASETAHESLMDTNVFRYYLHDNKDWDRNTSIRDRQRIEIKTEAKNPDINSYQGEILTNQWKFFLPEGYALPDEGSFFHIFQTKATQGDESSMPVFTLSVTKNHLYLHGSDCGHVNQVEYELASADIHDVLGRWIEAEITTYTAEKGYVYAKLQDISDPANKKLLMETGKKIDSWRRSEKLGEDGLYHEYDAPAVKNQMNRSKWGLYRKNDSPVPFDEMVMYLGDLRIIKHNAETYRFPDGFDPKEQTRDIYWAIESEPVKVLEGTDFSNIYLPAKVDVYVEGHDIESMEVERWEPGDYDQAVKGTYTVYGTLKETKGIENPKEVKAAVKIVVTDDISQKRVNWALGEAWGGTAKVKTLGGSNDNPSENLIDGSEETWWATNSGLIQQNEEDNGGWRYWAAVDLGKERTFDEIYYALGTIGSSKQFRLKNYTMFYSDNAKAWDELIGGTTGNPREKGVTPDPLKTAHGASW